MARVMNEWVTEHWSLPGRTDSKALFPLRGKRSTVLAAHLQVEKQIYICSTNDDANQHQCHDTDKGVDGREKRQKAQKSRSQQWHT